MSFLVRVSGHDRPGITADLMDVLSRGGARLFDIEQVAVRGRLNLGILIEDPEGSSIMKDLVYFGWERDLHVDFEMVASEGEPRSHASIVTVMAPEITPRGFGAVAQAVAGAGGNIDRIVRLSRYPVVSFELTVVGGDVVAMRRALGGCAAEHRIDVALQSAGLYRRAKRLVVMDVDSTLIQDEVIDLLAEEAGLLSEVAAVTEAAMAGELDFAESLRRRVGLLEGLDVAALESVAERIRLTPGARTFVRTLQRLGMKVAVVSGGFSFFTDRLRDELEIDHAFANTLEVVDGRLTGRVVGQIIDRAAKADLLRKVAELEKIPPNQTVAIGDGANDLDMLAEAGLGVAFNAKPMVMEAADTAVTVPYLDAILFLLGIRRDEVDEADSADGLSSPVIPVEGLPPR